MSVYQVGSVGHGGRSALIAAASDRKHRPASHPLLRGDTPIIKRPAPLVRGSMRSLRLARGLSHADIATALGVSRPAVSQWEAGTTQPSDEHLARLWEVLLR